MIEQPRVVERGGDGGHAGVQRSRCERACREQEQQRLAEVEPPVGRARDEVVEALSDGTAGPTRASGR